MKKVIISIIITVMSLSLIGCGSNNTKSASGDNAVQANQSQKYAIGDLKVMPEFKVKDINNNEVTNEVFKDKKVTMINIWGTFCGPCVEEMPELQELYTEYKTKGFNLIGVVADGETNEIQAMQILKKIKADFVNLIPNEKFNEDFVKKTQAVPVSVFVDNKGEVIETVIGSKTKDEYKQIIERDMEKV